MPPLTPNDLLPDARQQRFLSEIAAHTEDAGNNHAVGNTRALILHFNMYATERRHRALLRFAIIVLSIALLSSYSTLQIYNDNGEINSMWELVSVMPGTLLLVPVLFFDVIIAIFGLPSAIPWLIAHAIWIAPLISTMLWATVVYMLTFSPPTFLSHLSRK